MTSTPSTAPSTSGRSPTRLVLVGGPTLVHAGRVVRTRGPARQRASLALAYLVLARGRWVAADELAEAVWSGDLPASWASSLRRILSDVRAWLEGTAFDGALHTAREGYRLEVPVGATTDIDEAERSLGAIVRGFASLEDMTRAVELTTGELLPGLDAAWLEAHRRRVRSVRLEAGEALAEHLRRVGEHEQAIHAAEQVVAEDPLRESAYRVLMASHRDAGRVGAALRVYEDCRRRLVDEVGAPPSPPTVAVYQALLSPFGAAAARPSPVDAERATPSFSDAALAVETVASRAAIGNLEGRLAAMEADPHPDPIARVELLIELGQARWALSGATDQLRRISLAAGEAALQLRSPDLFGAVAALASTTTGVGERDADIEDLCRRALPLLGHDPTARARALALSSELRDGPEAVGLADEAVALARSLGDPALLLDTLLVLDQNLSWSPDVTRRLAVSAECNRLLRRQTRWRTRPTFEPLTRLQVGDVDWYRAEADRLATLSQTTTQWEPRFYATAYAAVLAQLAGDLDEAGRLAGRLLEQSREEINAVHSSAGLYLAIIRERGDIADALPGIELLAERYGTISAFGAAVALGRAVVGDADGARTLLDELLEPKALASAPRDHIWTLTLGLLAEATSLEGTPTQAALLHAELAPYAGQLCAGAHGTVLLGSIDDYRGALLLRAGEVDGAVVALAAAIDLEQRVGAPLLEARSQAWLARAQRTAGRPDDAAAAAARRLAAAPGTAAAVERVLG